MPASADYTLVVRISLGKPVFNGMPSSPKAFRTSSSSVYLVANHGDPRFVAPPKCPVGSGTESCRCGPNGKSEIQPDHCAGRFFESRRFGRGFRVKPTAYFIESERHIIRNGDSPNARLRLARILLNGLCLSVEVQTPLVFRRLRLRSRGHTRLLKVPALASYSLFYQAGVNENRRGSPPRPGHSDDPPSRPLPYLSFRVEEAKRHGPFQRRRAYTPARGMRRSHLHLKAMQIQYCPRRRELAGCCPTISVPIAASTRAGKSCPKKRRRSKP